MFVCFTPLSKELLEKSSKPTVIFLCALRILTFTEIFGTGEGLSLQQTLRVLQAEVQLNKSYILDFVSGSPYIPAKLPANVPECEECQQE